MMNLILCSLINDEFDTLFLIKNIYYMYVLFDEFNTLCLIKNIYYVLFDTLLLLL